MKYSQIDRITELTPGEKLVGERTLRPDEEYLQDHFPRLPVMPGVMMLEALHQAAVWLVRMTVEPDPPVVLLRETRGVKFGDFLAPGETLTVIAEWMKADGPLVTVKASAMKGEKRTVTARLILETCSSGDPDFLGTDPDLARLAREQFFQLYGDSPAVAALKRSTDRERPTLETH
ncbi:MAG: 3-hydroxyacyl-ACP dehydratase FabZ family protein [Planctomycetota bacterium]